MKEYSENKRNREIRRADTALTFKSINKQLDTEFEMLVKKKKKNSKAGASTLVNCIYIYKLDIDDNKTISNPNR